MDAGLAFTSGLIVAYMETRADSWHLLGHSIVLWILLGLLCVSVDGWTLAIVRTTTALIAAVLGYFPDVAVWSQVGTDSRRTVIFWVALAGIGGPIIANLRGNIASDRNRGDAGFICNHWNAARRHVHYQGWPSGLRGPGIRCPGGFGPVDRHRFPPRNSRRDGVCNGCLSSADIVVAYTGLRRTQPRNGVRRHVRT
jgi:hypothetical protein